MGGSRMTKTTPLTDADRVALARVRDAGDHGLDLRTLPAPVRRAVERVAAAGLVAVVDGVATAPHAPRPPDPLLFIGVRLPASLVRRLDALVGRRRATATVNPPTRSAIVRSALVAGLDAITAG